MPCFHSFRRSAAHHSLPFGAYQYDPVGRRIGSTLPNGIQCRQEFDERNRLLYLNYQKGARPVLTYKYGHNQLGQRIVEEKTSAEQCKLTRYCFNARRELIASDRRVGNGCGIRNEYRYDLNHNRIGQNQYRYQHNAADQLLNYPGPGSTATLAYNAQGQANQVGNLALTYNQSQQIKTAQNGSTYASYEYDASRRRTAKEVNGEREEYLMLGQEVLKTFDGSGNVKADYFLGLGREGMKTDGSWKYYLSDGLGSTALLTDGSGNTVAAYDYEDYGATTQIAGDAGVYNPYRYTGQEWDAELGMYNLRARHYSPSLGRFLARDPIGYGGGSNLMTYCQGDPIDFVDRIGLQSSNQTAWTLNGFNANQTGWLNLAYVTLIDVLGNQQAIQSLLGAGYDAGFYTALNGLLTDPSISLTLNPSQGNTAGTTFVGINDYSKIYVSDWEFYQPPDLTTSGQKFYLAYTLAHELAHVMQLRSLDPTSKGLTAAQKNRLKSDGQFRHPCGTFGTLQELFSKLSPATPAKYWAFND